MFDALFATYFLNTVVPNPNIVAGEVKKMFGTASTAEVKDNDGEGFTVEVTADGSRMSVRFSTKVSDVDDTQRRIDSIKTL